MPTTAVPARMPARYAARPSDLLALREEYSRLMAAAINLSRLAKRLDPGGSLDDATHHTNQAMSAIDNYRARVL